MTSHLRRSSNSGKRFILGTLACAVVVLSGEHVLGEATNRPLAVAIVTSGSGASSIAALVAQAEVALSKESNVAVVERSLINRILDEQMLSGALADKTVDADQALRLGKILKADLFAVVDVGSRATPGARAGASEQPGDLPVLSLVVFDVSTGRRYWDARLPGKMDAAVSALILAIRESGVKGRSLPADLHTVCVLPVRNVGLPREMDAFCETIGWLLDRQLTACSRVAVLERGRLEHVMAEHALPGIENDLRASLLTLEVETSRHEDGKGVLVKALLRDAAGKTHAAVQTPQPVADAQMVADSLMKELQRALGAKYEAGKLDRRLEAERFGHEAVALRRQGALEAAIRAGQAACALDPTDSNLRELAMNQLLMALTVTNTFRSAQLIRAATRNCQEALRCFGIFVPKGQLEFNSANNLDQVFGNCFMSLMDEWPIMHSFSPPPRHGFGAPDSHGKAGGEEEKERALAAEECAAFLEDQHAALLDWCMQWTDRDGRGIGGSYAWLFRRSGGSRSLMDTFQKRSAAYNRTRLRSGSRFLDGLARYPDAIAKLSENQIAPEENLLEAAVGLQAEEPEPAPENVALRKEQLARMRAHPLAAVRAFAPLAELHDGILKRVDAPEREKLLQAVMGEVLALIKRADVPANQQPLVAIAGIQAIQVAAGRPEDQFANLTVLWEALLTNNAAMPRAATMMLQNGQSLVEKLKSQDSAVRLRGLVQKSLELNDASGGRLFHSVGRLQGDVQVSERSWRSRTSRDDFSEYLAKTKADVAAVQPTFPENAPVGCVFDPVTKRAKYSYPSPPILSLPPWRNLRSVIRFGGEVPGSCSYPSIVRNDSVFVTVMPNDTHVTAVRVPLSGGTPAILGTAETSAKTRITCMDVDDANVYVGTENEVLLFPLSGGPVKRFGAGKELPQSAVHGLASVGGELFVGLDNFITAWRVDTGVFRLVACNRRRERISPFDDRAAFHVDSLFADPARKRFLVLVVVEFEKNSTGGLLDESVSGIWEYRTETGVFRRIFGAVGLGTRGFRISDSEIGWASGRSVQAIDLERDCARWVSLGVEDAKLWGVATTPEMFLTPRERSYGYTAIPVPWLNYDKPPRPPSIVFVGDRMWMCGPFSRLTRNGEMDVIPEKEFGEVIGLHVLKGGQEVLITARDGLWVVTL